MVTNRGNLSRVFGRDNVEHDDRNCAFERGVKRMAQSEANEDEQLCVNAEQVCVIIQVGKTTLNQMIRDGEFPAPMIFGRRVHRWPREQVLTWLAAQWKPEPPDRGPGRPRNGVET